MTEIDLPRRPAIVRLSDTLRASRKSIFLGTDELGTPLFANSEDSVVVLGKPRSDVGVTGKTSGIFIPSVACHPGLVIATSVRSGYGEHPDLRDSTIRAREQIAQHTGGSVFEWVLDDAYPTLGKRGWWSLVEGCREWNVALDRAQSLAYGAIKPTSSNPEYFRNHVVSLLAPVLCFASRTSPQLTDQDVVFILGNATWGAAEDDADDADPASPVGMMSRIADHLVGWFGEDHPSVTNLKRFYDESHMRTEDRQIVNAVIAAEVFALYSYDQGPALDDITIDQLMTGSSTLYISVSESRSKMVQPLINAFCGSLTRKWRATPPTARPSSLLLALDEAAAVAPLEALPELISTGGGDGIQCLVGFQDTSQARAHWGDRGPEVFNGASFEVLFAGVRDTDHLERLKNLLPKAFQYDRRVTVVDGIQTNGRYAAPERLIRERTTLEDACSTASENQRPRIARYVADQLLRQRALDGIRVRPVSEESMWKRLLSELDVTTRVELRPERREVLDTSDLARGRPGTAFVMSGTAASHVNCVGWWRDDLWSQILEPVRPEGMS